MSVTAPPPPPAAPAPMPAPRNVPPVRPSRMPDWLGNPWGRPRWLRVTTFGYIAWSLLPVLAAIVFSFNDGRSRSVWQGFSTRWWWGDPNLSVFHDPIYTNALVHSLELAALDMLIATPLGFLLALGLSRWRGRGSGTANFLMLVPLTTPELAMAVSLLLVFTQLSILPFTAIALGTGAQVIGQVTFSVSYVVVIVRSRLAAIGPEYEEAARDLGANARQSLQHVLFPLLLPAAFASTLIVFALSIDDFVVTQYMSAGGETVTIPMLLYANARGAATTPALNAVATIMVIVTLLGVGGAYLVLRWFGKRSGEAQGDSAGAMGMDLTGMD
ncbi:MAG TPA: ABC transporter permease [Solirubrobacterales bacterium]|nr:ABC transporter permease [Solirubrobacterales bacterium]